MCGRCGRAIPCGCRECGRCGRYNLAPDQRRYGRLRGSSAQVFCESCAEEAVRDGVWEPSI